MKSKGLNKQKKSVYQRPVIREVKISRVRLLTGTNEQLYFNPADGTTDALSRRGGGDWDCEDE